MGEGLLAKSFSSFILVELGQLVFSLSIVDTVWYLLSLLFFFELYLGCLEVKKSRMFAAFGWTFGLACPSFFLKSSRTMTPVTSFF